MSVNPFLRGLLFTKGLYSTVFYISVVVYIIAIVIRYCNPFWRALYNLNLVDLVANITIPLVALESLGNYSNMYLQTANFGHLSQGIILILIFINNSLHIIKIFLIFGLSGIYSIKVFNAFKNKNPFNRAMFLDCFLAVFFILTILLYLADKQGNYFFGKWDTISRL